MRIIKTADYNEMSKTAANIIAAQMILKPNSVLGLATGSSPIGTYKELIKNALILCAITMVAGLLLGTVYEVTKEPRKEQEEKGTIAIATVFGDIHDIGKNIVKAMLENYGYKVIDLGKNVPAEAVVEAVVTNHAPMAGLSALMTTTVVNMEETVRLIHEKAPWCQVIVGGAVLSQDYAEQMGADFYAKDAMQTVHFAEEFINLS